MTETNKGGRGWDSASNLESAPDNACVNCPKHGENGCTAQDCAERARLEDILNKSKELQSRTIRTE